MTTLPILDFVWLPLAFKIGWGALIFAASTMLSFILRSKPRKSEPQAPYGWEPQTTQREGIPYELCFGTVPVNGNAFSPWTNIINQTSSPGFLTAMFTPKLEWPEFGESNHVVISSRQQLNVRIAFGEGPVQGLQTAYSRLHGKPLADWTGVTTVERKGTDIQTATGGGDRIEFARDDLVADDASVTITLSDKDPDDIAIIVGSTDGLMYMGQNGSKLPQLLGVKIEAKNVTDESWTTIFNYYLLGSTINPVRWIFRASLGASYKGGSAFTCTPGSQAQFLVTSTFRPSVGLVQGKLKIFGIQAIYSSSYTHPGLAFLEVQAMNTEGLNGQLEYEGILDGLICETIAGSTFAWSQNPAVAMKYLWTMPVICGDGGGTAFSVDYYRGYNPTDLNVAEFAAAETWFNLPVPDGKGGTEARFKFNGRFSEPAEAWENPTKVAAMCHSVTWFDGREVRMYIDKATTASHIFCDANTIKDSYNEQSVDKRDNPTAIEATIFNEEAGWVAQTVRIVDKLAPVQNNVVQIDGFGCTRVSQLARFARRIFDKNRNLDLVNNWQSGPWGMDAEKGHVCYVQSDRNGRAVGGRISSAPDTDTVVIDQSVVMTPGTAYKLIVQTLDDDGKHVVAYDVASLDDPTTVVITGALTYTPVNGDIYIYGAADNIDQYRITSTKWDEYGNCEFTGEQYKAAYYANDDVAPYFNTDVYVTASKPQRKSFQAVTREDLLTNYDDAKLLDADETDAVIASSITFAGDSVDTVTWTVDGAEDLGWIRYKGVNYPIQADAVGTTDTFIYFDPNALDPTVLQHTSDLADLKGYERFLGCVNDDGVAIAQNWQRVGVNDTSLEWALITGAGKPEDNATVGATWNVDITDQPAGYLVQWKGDLAAPPADPEDGWAYRDTTDGVSYVYHDGFWYYMAVDGYQGYQGQQGNQGSQGPEGSQGLKGEQGSVGATGSTGPKGDQGNQGNQGNQGYQGQQGSVGATGSTGPKGDQGNQGNQGNQGYQGQQGNQGYQGSQGATGATGASGVDYQGPWNSGTQYVGGTDLVSSGGTTYICILTHTNHQPPNATYWDVFALQGTQGSEGPQGPPGNQGQQGATGATGPTGNQGVQGATGATGPTGNQGYQGATGPTGNQGQQGSQGLAGQQGPPGLLGETLANSVSIAAGGLFKIGSGTKDSTLNGIQIDNTEIVGQIAGVDQFYLKADGSAMVKLIAVSGAGDLAALNTVDTDQVASEAITQITSVDDYTGYDLLASPYSASGYGKWNIMAAAPSITSGGYPCWVFGEGQSYATLAAATPAENALFCRDNAETNIFISTITLSGTNPVLITTAVAHGLSTDNYVWLAEVGGSIELNGGIFRITVVDATKFTLQWTRSDRFTGYTSGGRVRLVHLRAIRYGTQPAGTGLDYQYSCAVLDELLVASHSYKYLFAFKNLSTSVNGYGEEATVLGLEIKR